MRKKEKALFVLILIGIPLLMGVIVYKTTTSLDSTFIAALTAALVVVTCYYAYATRQILQANNKLVKTTKNTSLAQIIMQLTDAYAQPEMLQGMKRLRHFKETHSADFGRKFSEMKKQNKKHYDTLDEDRRRFSHYFRTLFVMLDADVIDVEFLKKIVPPGKDDQVDFLLQVIEPLEKEIDANYDTSMFVTFQKIYHKIASIER